MNTRIHAKIIEISEALLRVKKAAAPRIRTFHGNRPTNKKWALVSYLPDAVSMKDSDPRMKSHSNWWECREIARILSSLGYNVEAMAATNVKTIPDRQYDLILDTARNIQRLAPYQKPTTKYILLLTGSHYSWSIEAERTRVADFEQTHGVRYSLRYGAMPTPLLDKSLEISDVAMLIGNETTLSTYPERFRGKIVCIPATPAVCPFRKKYDKTTKSFLFFSGPCNVLKGLDLTIDAFLRNPDWTLHIVGNQQKERDFLAAYPAIGQTNNIHFHGFLIPGSDAFGKLVSDCSAFIAPTCTEGSSTAAILLCTIGMFPITSTRIGIDFPAGCGIQLPSLDIETVEKSIRKFIAMPVKNVEIMAEQARQAVSTRYNRNSFSDSIESILTSLQT